MEQWKIIDESPDYEISNYGRVKSNKRNRALILSPRVDGCGYYRVSLSTNGKSKDYRINVLVAKYFIDNPENKLTVNHKDGNKQNNHYTNLEWATYSEQMYHAYNMGLKIPRYNRQFLTDDEIRYIHNVYKPHNKQYGMRALAKKYNVSCETIKRWVKEEDVEKCLKTCNDYRKAMQEKYLH